MRTTLKALITSLVIGTSALASAAPCEPAPAPQPAYTYTAPVHNANLDTGPVYKEPVYTQPVYTPPVYEVPVYQRPVRSWTNLSGGLVLKGTVDISVGKAKGAFDKLELVSGWGNGSTKVRTVTVWFSNGETQTVQLNRTLDNKETVTIDLAGRNARSIKKVEITGSSRGRSAIELRGI